MISVFIITLPGSTLASYFEHCLLYGIVTSDLQASSSDQINFEFVPASSQTLDNSHRECNYWHDKTMLVITNSPNEVEIRVGASVSIKYMHSDSACQPGESCSTTNYEIIEVK